MNPNLIGFCIKVRNLDTQTHSERNQQCEEIRGEERQPSTNKGKKPGEDSKINSFFNTFILDF